MIFVASADHFLIFVELTRTQVTLENIAEFFNNASLVIGSAICILRIALNWTGRAKISALLFDLNVKFKVASKECDANVLQYYLDSYLILSWVVIITVGGLNLFSALTLFYSFATGKAYFKLYTPFEEEPYGLLWWSEIVFSGVSAAYCFTFFSFVHCQLMDCGILLAFLHKVQNEKLKSELVKMSKDQVRSVFMELIELKALSKTYLEIINPDQFLVWAFGALGQACSCVCVAIEMEKGLISVLSVVIYPMWVLLLMLGWSLIGSNYEDNVSK